MLLQGSSTAALLGHTHCCHIDAAHLHQCLLSMKDTNVICFRSRKTARHEHMKLLPELFDLQKHCTDAQIKSYFRIEGCDGLSPRKDTHRSVLGWGFPDQGCGTLCWPIRRSPKELHSMGSMNDTAEDVRLLFDSEALTALGVSCA